MGLEGNVAEGRHAEEERNPEGVKQKENQRVASRKGEVSVLGQWRGGGSSSFQQSPR